MPPTPCMGLGVVISLCQLYDHANIMFADVHNLIGKHCRRCLHEQHVLPGHLSSTCVCEALSMGVRSGNVVHYGCSADCWDHCSTNYVSIDARGADLVTVSHFSTECGHHGMVRFELMQLKREQPLLTLSWPAYVTLIYGGQ